VKYKDFAYNAQVTSCPNNSTLYCCGGNNINCCGTTSAIFIAEVDGSISSMSTPTSTFSTPKSVSGNALTTGGKARIGAGVGVAVLALLLLVGFYVIRKRKAAAERNGALVKIGENDGKSISELHSYSIPGELPGA